MIEEISRLKVIVMYNTEEQMEMNTILRILEDLHPHSVTEIVSLVNISAEKTEFFFRFLAKYSFVSYDEQSETAVICADFLSLKEEDE